MLTDVALYRKMRGKDRIVGLHNKPPFAQMFRPISLFPSRDWRVPEQIFGGFLLSWVSRVLIEVEHMEASKLVRAMTACFVAARGIMAIVFGIEGIGTNGASFVIKGKHFFWLFTFGFLEEDRNVSSASLNEVAFLYTKMMRLEQYRCASPLCSSILCLAIGVNMLQRLLLTSWSLVQVYEGFLLTTFLHGFYSFNSCTHSDKSLRLCAISSCKEGRNKAKIWHALLLEESILYQLLFDVVVSNVLKTTPSSRNARILYLWNAALKTSEIKGRQENQVCQSVSSRYSTRLSVRWHDACCYRKFSKQSTVTSAFFSATHSSRCSDYVFSNGAL